MIFNYNIETKENLQIVSLSGSLMEKTEANELVSEIENYVSEGFNKIILNLENLKYLNSSGLSVLITILTKCRNTGGEVVISNLSDKVKELFLITKLNTVFTVTESIDEAVPYFG